MLFKQTNLLYRCLCIGLIDDLETTRLQLYVPACNYLPKPPFQFYLLRGYAWQTGEPLSPWDQIGFADHVQPYRLSDKCVAFVWEWIQNFTKSIGKHSRCPKPSIPPLPTRFVYVGGRDEEIYLHVSKSGEISHCTPLSHRWGGMIPTRTTTGCVEQYLVHIPTPYHPHSQTPWLSQECLASNIYGLTRSVSSRVQRLIGNMKLERWPQSTRILFLPFQQTQPQTASQGFSTSQLGVLFLQLQFPILFPMVMHRCNTFYLCAF